MLNTKLEPNAASWLLRGLLGPAQLVDGAVATVTLGTVNLGLALAAARRLARERMAFDARSTPAGPGGGVWLPPGQRPWDRRK